MTEFVFHGAKDLAAVFEGVRVGDFELDGDFGNGHFSGVDPTRQICAKSSFYST